jgi:DNA-binding CsgD family transcriptional regulator
LYTFKSPAQYGSITLSTSIIDQHMPTLSHEQLNKLTCKASQASKIIHPLQKVGITGVFYERIYFDGSTINIASDHDWTKFYFEKIASGSYTTQSVSEYYFAKPGFSLSALMPKNQLWLDAQHQFGHGNGVTLIEDHCSFREVIGFYSTSQNAAINDFYMNNLSTIKQLKQYFVLEASSVIQDLEQDRLISFYKTYDDQEKIVNPRKGISLTNYLNNTLCKKKLVTDHVLITNKKTGLPICLTPQRGKCLLYLTQGKSSKEIARLMDLSRRTVEHYLAKLRYELGCKTSKELIFVYGEQLQKYQK